MWQYFTLKDIRVISHYLGVLIMFSTLMYVLPLITAIGSFAFAGNASITGVVVPAEIREIGDAAFSGCTALRWVRLSNGVRRIGSAAFNNCSSLGEISSFY